MKLVKGFVRIGIHTRFGPNWPGQRCLAKTRRGTKCQRAAYKHNGRCALHGGRSTGPTTQWGLCLIVIKNFCQVSDLSPELTQQSGDCFVTR